jgi:hypothetical protein
MHVTIDAEQRAELWSDLTIDLTGIDAVYLAIQGHEWEEARALRCRFEQDMRLLDDIGWAEQQPGERFDLTIAPEELRPTLQRLHDNASRHAHELLGGTRAALRGVEIYADLLERLDAEPRQDPDDATSA